jgi:hypothetical protein
VAETRYSSRGPGRAPGAFRRGPDLLAPGDQSPVRAGLRAAGSRSGTVFTMGGTSAAAPIVTRQIVEWLCRAGSLDRATIAAKLRELDVAGLTSASATRG